MKEIKDLSQRQVFWDSLIDDEVLEYMHKGLWKELKERLDKNVCFGRWVLLCGLNQKSLTNTAGSVH